MTDPSKMQERYTKCRQCRPAAPFCHACQHRRPLQHQHLALSRLAAARGAQTPREGELRKEHNLTQQSLAEALGTTQQQVASYEIARLRIPASMLPRLARVLGVSLETLIGEEDKPAKRGPTPKMQQQLERLSNLPKPKQRAVMEVIEAVLAQASR